MSKDRARPFSRKHRKYWFTVTGGMILIGVINISLGYCTYDPGPSEPPEKIELVLPHAVRDAGVDASTATPPPAPPTKTP